MRVTAAGGTKPRWGADGRTLYFLRGDDLSRVTVMAGGTPSVSAPQTVARLPGLRDFDAARRSDRLLAILPAPAARPLEVRALVDWQASIAPAQ